MPNDVTTDLKVDNKDMKRELDKSERAFEKFGKSVKRIAVAIGAAFAAKKLFGWGSAVFGLYAEQERAEAKLAQVVKATGGAAGFTTEELKKMAAQMQEVTTFGDEVIINAQGILATFKNIKGDIFKDAMKAMLDMATLTGGDLSSAAMQMGKALNDPIKGMGALADAGVAFTDQQKELITALVKTGHTAEAQRVMLAELEGQVGGLAEAVGATNAGKLQQFKNRLGDIGESIGAALLPALEAAMPLIEWFMARVEETIPIVIDWTKSIGEFAGSIFEYMKPALEWFQEAMIQAFTVVQTAITSFVDIANAALMEFQLDWIKTWETVKHWITEVMPEYLQWFGRNWASILKDMASFTSTVVGNMWDNLKNFFKNVWSWLKGGETNWEWTGLLEGFESSLEELPKIAERHKTRQERTLERDLESTYRRIARRYRQNLEVNRAAMAGFWGSFVPATADEAAGEGRIVKGKPYMPEQRFGALGARGKKGKDEEGEAFRASIEDLVAMNRRITQAAAGGGAEDVNKAQLKAQKEAAKEAAKMAEFQRIANAHLQRVGDNTGEMLTKIEEIGALK